MTREGETGPPGKEAWEAEEFGRRAGFEGSTVIQMEGSWWQLELRLASGSEARWCQGKPGGMHGVVRSRPRTLARLWQHVRRGSSKEPMQGAEDRPVPLLLFLFTFSNGNYVLFLFKKPIHTVFLFKEGFLPQLTHQGFLCEREAVKVPPASHLLPVIAPWPFLG